MMIIVVRGTKQAGKEPLNETHLLMPKLILIFTMTMSSRSLDLHAIVEAGPLIPEQEI